MADNKAKKPAKATALFIRSVSKQGFRRAGFAFTPDGFGIAVDALTEEQIKALRDEPNLIVEDAEIEAAGSEQ